MTDDERQEAIVEFVEFAEREGWMLRRQVLFADVPEEKFPSIEDAEFCWLLDDFMKWRIPT